MRENAYMCMAESLRWSPETIMTLLTGYIPIQHKFKFQILFKAPYDVASDCPQELTRPHPLSPFLQGYGFTAFLPSLT